MFEELKRALQTLEKVVKDLDPEVLEPAFATELVQSFAKGERLCAAGKALAARQVAHSGVWRNEGDKSPGRWMARKTGEPIDKALGELETAEKLKELPQTEEALKDGRLNSSQAKEIASAASESPKEEKDLLKAAESEPFDRLKKRCRRVKAAAKADEVARHEAIRKARYLRHYTDDEGAFHLEAKMTPEDGALVLSALQPFERRLTEEARRQARAERRQALFLDALVALAEDSRREGPSSKGPRTSPGAMIHVLVDHSAFVRGETKEGETCEIPGVGPISVGAALSLASDAFLTAILKDGEEIQKVVHLGRNIPARVRTALRLRDESCVVPGCTEKNHLQIDHIEGVLKPTKLDGLALLCNFHHYLKTFHGYRLTGPPGSWGWEPPAKRKPRRRKRGPP